MKGEHYHYYLIFQTEGGRLFTTTMKSKDKCFTYSDIVGAENILKKAHKFNVLTMTDWKLLECDCEPESEDTQVNEVLEAIEEREKSKEIKRMMGHE